ncbi:uncharacterized protein F54H12.2 [Cephus cinctus]|uniref:Uncharacterized protein F54H12.2 n=1 Tax=Cephus cinctus TaxID=211228 RepID=A0AAJ7BS07_CEPCN|nr:uncharacterized protein F54H12.2 [Cephus cinctus]
MAFLHAYSCECMKSEPELFTLPPTQTTIESAQWVHYKPISSLTDDSPIEFVVPGNGDEYLVASSPCNLAHTMLSLRVQLRSKNAAYIETFLNYGPAAKESHLSSVLWYNDTPGHMHDTAGKNIGLANRQAFVGKNSTVDLIGHLHCDVFNQEIVSLNSVEHHLRLIRTRDGFSLMEPKRECSLHITEVTLLVRRTKINPGILLAHSKMLSKMTAKYPLTRVEVKVLTMHAGLHGSTMDNVSLRKLSKRIIIGFIYNKAFNVPSKALQTDFDKAGLYVDAYHTLFSGTGINFLNEGNSISKSAYADGYCLFVFDLTPDLSANSNTHWNLIKHGSVRIEVRSDEPLATTVDCIVYAEYDNVLEIDASRQIVINYGG